MSYIGRSANDACALQHEIASLPKMTLRDYAAELDETPLTGKSCRDHGGVRPMAVAADEVFVFGKFSYGHYPIEVRRTPKNNKRFTITMTGEIENLGQLLTALRLMGLK